MEENQEQPKRGRPKGSKSTNLTKAEVKHLRNLSIKKVFNEHMGHTQYVRWCTKEYGMSKKRCQAYYYGTWKDVEEKFRMEKDKLITKHINAYWEIYNKAVEKEDLNTARQTLNDLARMGGLNEPDAVDINHMGEITFKFGDEN